MLREDMANKKVVMGRLGKKLHVSLSDPSEVASFFSSRSTSASSLAAHSEHVLVADSPSTAVLGTGPPNSKWLVLESEASGLTPEEIENAGAVVGGPNLS